MEKKHVIIVCERHDDGIYNPNSESVLPWHMEESLRCSELATYSTICFDEFARENNTLADNELIARCEAENPYCLLICWCFDDVIGNASNPRLETLMHIRKNLNIPIVMFWWDYTSWRGALSEMFSPLVDLHVSVDCPVLPKTRTRYPEKFTNTNGSGWWDLSVLRDNGKVREYDVAFVGRIFDRRHEALQIAKSLGLNVFASDSSSHRQLSFEELADVYQRTKMVINFSHTGKNQHHVKGRAWEAIYNGAMLLEWDNPKTAHYFDPHTEYVPFYNMQDLAAKLMWYKSNDAERVAIAERACRRAHAEYTPRHLWEAILYDNRVLRGRDIGCPMFD